MLGLGRDAKYERAIGNDGREEVSEHEMELGNMVFGNSRGEYPLGRGVGFEEELFRLFDAYAPKRDNSWREYGEEFENDTFAIMPYYWGDCECGYDEKESEWCEKNDHQESCISIEIRHIAHYDRFKSPDIFLAKYLTPIFEKHALSTSDKNWWYGYMTLCTCDYENRWQKFLAENNHSKDCRLIKPNFLYKPNGFEIQWYKYPLRDSYTNQKITLLKFKKIIDDCIRSVS